LVRWAETEERHVLVRDWSFISFVPNLMNSGRPPERLVTWEVLRDRFSIRSIALIRNPIDIWISRGMPDLPLFCAQYRSYVEAVKSAGAQMFRYEAFCAAPTTVLERICRHLQVDAAANLFGSLGDARQVTGDVVIEGGSRGSHLSGITLLPRKRILCDEIQLLESSQPLRDLCIDLNYVPAYDARPVESYREMLTRRARRAGRLLAEDPSLLNLLKRVERRHLSGLMPLRGA
jgi:hypothetical protein